MKYPGLRSLFVPPQISMRPPRIIIPLHSPLSHMQGTLSSISLVKLVSVPSFLFPSADFTLLYIVFLFKK